MVFFIGWHSLSSKVHFEIKAKYGMKRLLSYRIVYRVFTTFLEKNRFHSVSALNSILPNLVPSTYKVPKNLNASVLEMDFFRRLETMAKPNILTCTDDLYVAKSWPFWYLCLLYIRKFHRGTQWIFSKKLQNLWFFQCFFFQRALFKVNLGVFELIQGV